MLVTVVICNTVTYGYMFYTSYSYVLVQATVGANKSSHIRI